MKLLSLLTVAALLSQSALATDLNLSVRAGGDNSVTVAPGETVSYEIVAELSDTASQGLASIVFDLSFEGGVLDPVTVSPGMANFDRPAGFTNPQGFGGVVEDGAVIQIGGAQNTINNVFAPVPNGTVQTGVAAPGASVVVATGSLTAPLEVGNFTLEVLGLDANVIKAGESGIPFWGVEAAGGNISNLDIEVVALTGDVATISLTGLGSQVLTLDAGQAHANMPYIMWGSASGTKPGLLLSGQVIPLVYDSYTEFIVANPINGILSNGVGKLDDNGRATAVFTIPPRVRPGFAGKTIYHAYYLLPTGTFVSEAEAVTLTP